MQNGDGGWFKKMMMRVMQKMIGLILKFRHPKSPLKWKHSNYFFSPSNPALFIFSVETFKFEWEDEWMVSQYGSGLVINAKNTVTCFKNLILSQYL